MLFLKSAKVVIFFLKEALYLLNLYLRIVVINLLAVYDDGSFDVVYFYDEVNLHRIALAYKF